jgi:DNA repair protein RadD
MQLRPQQQDLEDRVFDAWGAGQQAVCMVSPTGTGKTVVASSIMRRLDAPGVTIAHRQELVAQMSVTLARYGVRHRLIASETTRRIVEGLHAREFKRRWLDHTAPVAVAGAHTITKMSRDNKFLKSCKFWCVDESHHLLKDNVWGKAVSLFPQDSLGLGPTATPLRADGKGLGRHAHGLFDAMVVGQSMRSAIDSGMLTDYRIYAPETKIDLSNVPDSADGDWSKKPLAAAVHRSTLVGDIVESYLRIAPGKRGITFAVDIEDALRIAAAYNAAGVRAEMVCGETDPIHRAQVMREFAAGTILQLVNVDLLGEGVDVPACEVVSFGRPTKSFGLYVQMFGRALRLMLERGLMERWGYFTDEERRWHVSQSVKPYAVIIDHVGLWDIRNHGLGLPDAPKQWTLDARPKKSKAPPSTAIPLRNCLGCYRPYERVLLRCPYCGTVPEPQSRAALEYVDGDLMEVSPAVLAQLRGEHARIMAPVQIPWGADGRVAGAIKKHHWERQQAQNSLGHAIAMYGGWQNAMGREDQEAYRRFYYEFGIDVATARTIKAADADTLRGRVEGFLTEKGVGM